MTTSNNPQMIPTLYDIVPLKKQVFEISDFLAENNVFLVDDGYQDDYEFLQRLLSYARNRGRWQKFFWFAQRNIKISITLDFNVSTDGTTLKMTPLIATFTAKRVYGSQAYENPKSEPATVEECLRITESINTMLDLEGSD